MTAPYLREAILKEDVKTIRNKRLRIMQYVTKKEIAQAIELCKELGKEHLIPYIDNAKEYKSKACLATRLIRKMLEKQQVNVPELCDLLKEHYGIKISPHGIHEKLWRGKFSAEFFLQVADVLSVRKVDLTLEQ